MTARPLPPALRALGVVALVGAVLAAGAPAVITIKPGDTLWELALRHRTSVAELQRLNDLEGRATIYAGQTLRVPGSPAASRTARPTTRTVEGSHRVAAGDNLTRIAARYGTTTRWLIARNRLPKDGTIVIGRALAYPRTITVTGRATTGSTRGTATHNAGVAIPGSVRESVARHRRVLAQRDLPSKATVRRMVERTARRHGVDPRLALAVAYHESGFQQRVVSVVDAIGVMQVLPSTARGIERAYGVDLDLLDTQDNVTAGVLLLRQLTRAVTTPERVLAGYYQGLGSISRRGVLPQTEQYIRNVTYLMRHRFS
ncbi:MAG: LysM peptidoglycan-binding domain-containing protein [Mycobacteriales bacterium]|nr:LysM peptidoglycan-binding domain-containing protein [Mycobacteriales bacterium]